VAVLLLQSKAGDQLGFLMLAGSAPRETSGARKCILTGFPMSTSLWDEPLARFILERKHVEFLATVTGQDSALGISVDCGEGDGLRIELAGDAGTWCAVANGVGLGEGACVALQK